MEDLARGIVMLKYLLVLKSCVLVNQVAKLKQATSGGVTRVMEQLKNW
jgi:hypothetical protein